MRRTVPIVRPAGVVTPEAVVLDFNSASVGSRVVAILLDLLVMLTLLTAVTLIGALVVNALGAPDWLAIALLFIATFLAVFGYPCILESLWRGRTVGKAAVGLRVVTTEGAPIRFRHAALRAMLGLVDFWIPPGGATAIVTVLCSSRNQRLGDVVAGTIVLDERIPAGVTDALWFTLPPSLDAFAQTLDTSRLGVDDQRLARSYLVRSATLSTAAQAHLSRQLAARMTAKVGVLPPPGVSDEWFLACVVAAYQRRLHASTPAAASMPSAWPWARWTPPGPAVASGAAAASSTGFQPPG
jgi:uncharacterized RDD family membrane protein YckC